MQYDFDFSAILQGQYPSMLISGLLTTLGLTVLAWLLGFSVGIMLAIIRMTGSRLANGAIALFVAFHRNVPMVVHILFWYFGVSQILPRPVTDWLNYHGSEFFFAMVAIGLVTSAYVCEDLRSAVRSISEGQTEASRALGMNYLTTMRKVILPQAFRIAIPPLMNQTLLLFKNTSLAMVIGVAELTASGRAIENITFRTFEAYALVTIMYLAISFLLMWGGSVLARRFSIAGAR